jgi:ethanolamine ammonia-lyase small subunit
MDDRFDRLVRNADSAEIVRRIKMHTPARLLVGRAGAAYRTETQLQLREDHAKARDAVRAELELKTAFDVEFIEKWNLFEAN